VAYSSVSAIKTVFSLNAVQTMIDKYSVATLEAYRQATGVLIKQGFFNGKSCTMHRPIGAHELIPRQSNILSFSFGFRLAHRCHVRSVVLVLVH
jgi:hypothetical protein